MIWGCQWDATLRWMQTSSDEKVKNFPTNSVAYGNYLDNTVTYKESENGEDKLAVSRKLIPTGGSEQTKINNIYDLAGNAWEWTMQAGGRETRIAIGGTCYYDGNSASTKTAENSRANNFDYGSRLTLYITP